MTYQETKYFSVTIGITGFEGFLSIPHTHGFAEI
jgi:hypothetical protein